MTKMPLAEHNNVVKALPSDRTDQSFSIAVLPWGTRSGANAGRLDRFSPADARRFEGLETEGALSHASRQMSWTGITSQL